MSKPGMASVIGVLERARSGAKALLVAGEVSRILAIVLGVVVGVAIIDFGVRLPVWLRVALWLAGAGLIVWSLIKYVVPALRFNPNLTEMALRLERSEQGRQAGLTDRLASAIELERAAHEPGVESDLAARAVSDAARRASSIRAGATLAPAWSSRRVGGMALAVAVCVVLWLLSPTLATIGASRVLAPWAGTEWPKRTLVADVTSDRVHAIGRSLALRALLTKTDRPVGDTRVVAKYRVVVGDDAGTTRRVLMTSQRAIVDEDDQTGELFERLIETRGVASGASDVRIEYWFETEDDKTDVQRVRLEEPPEIVRSTATVMAPDYARDVAGMAGFVEGDFELGSGDDERAVVGPVLAGSTLGLTVEFNKPVLAPAPGEGGVGEPDVTPTTWSFAWVASESLRLPIAPIDEHGLGGFEEAVFSFDVGEDRRPSAAVIEPAQDEAVLATAVIDLVGEGQDDVGVGAVRLERRLALVPEGSIGAPPEEQADLVLLAETIVAKDSGFTPRAVARSTLELASLNLSAGDEVLITALVSDTFGAARDPVRSSPRRLRVIAEADMVEQIRSELAGVRSAAMRLDEEQARVGAGVRRGEDSGELSRQQSDIEARIGRQQELVDSMAERLERNRLEDPVLEGTISDASALLESAQGAAREAAGTLSEAASREASPTEQEQERIESEQERVRDELQRLTELLDRGEDAWLVQRQLERLLSEQQALMEETRQAGQQTTGRRLDQLDSEERSNLEQIAERQRELSDRLEQAIEDLEERSEQLRDIDGVQSQAMQESADRARRENVSQEMQEAADQAEQNQTNQAQENQQEAADALQRMLDELEQSEQRRDETLRRVLASLIESLETLIAQQEREIAALDRAKEDDAYEGLDQSMIRLHQNTLGVLDEVSAGFAELATLRTLVDRAAEAQSAAIVALRETPVDVDRADANERESLRRLREARAEAQQLDEEAAQREADRQRAELEDAYREALETQVAIRGDTEPLIDNVKTRRDRQKSRRLGAAERDLRQRLAELADQSEALEGLGVFEFAHKRLDTLLERVETALIEGRADQGVKRDQDSIVLVLTSLVQALKQDQAEEDFRDAEQGNQAQQDGATGQEQEPPAIAPIAELKLLRMLQEEIMLRTRMADEEGTSDDEVSELGESQRELSEHANELIEKMSQPQGAPGGGQ